MPPPNNIKNHARLRVALILALLSLIGAATVLLGPARLASAQSSASWTFTGNLNSARANHTATLLQNGKVLVAGGRVNPSGGIVNSAELYDLSTGTWSSTGPSTGRFAHTAALLPNGKVLVIGGYDGSHPLNVLNSAELYDPATGTWSVTGNLNTPRAGWHTATLLPNGKVLVVGGIVDSDGHTTNRAELYDSATGIWTSTGSLNSPLFSTAMLLPNGKVLVFDWDDNAELYDPATGTWSITVHPGPFRYSYSATLLQNGKVLLAGGLEYDCSGSCPSASAELYDPATGTWTSTGSLNLAGGGDTAMLLHSGKVLVFGGGNSAELYDPATGTWSLTASINTARGGSSTTLLSNGKVLVAGGNVSGGPGTLNSAELYDPGTGSTPTPTPTQSPSPTPTPTPTPTATPTPTPVVGPSWTITGNLNTGRDGHSATLLPDGKVLIAAGSSGNTSELYDPATGLWTDTGNLNSGHALHTATLLLNGKVLVAAGFTDGAELYDPATGLWSRTGNLNSGRLWHTATLLPSGKVLVAGGFFMGLALNSAELYDPGTGLWSHTGNLNAARAQHTATLLPNGKVLVAAGAYGECITGLCSESLNSAELYDPATGTWSSTGSLNTARAYQAASPLPDGKFLVAGGYYCLSGTSDCFGLGSAELYDPATGVWSNTGSLNLAVFLRAALLLNGKVLVVGQGNQAQLYDPTTGTWSYTANLNNGHSYPTATLLLNGKVLITGGQGALNSAELYDYGSDPEQVALKSWSYQGRTYAYVKLSFPNSGYFVADWGLPARSGNDFSVSALVEHSSGASVLAVTTTAQIYDLGALADGNYTFTFKNSSTVVQSLTFTIDSVPPPPNPIDTAREFVKQQYRDFLNREADPAGEDNWTNNITKCSDPAQRLPGQTEAQCTLRQRETTSGAFVLSPEFHYTGSFVYRMYQGALGRPPKLSEFTPDAQFVGAGIIVNGQLSGVKINQNKADFAVQFVNCTDAARYRCAEFKTIYDGLSNQQYVDKLFEKTGVNASASDRDALVNGLNGGTETRASVLQKVVDGIVVISEGNQQFTTSYGQAFYNSELNRAFVQLEYFGYMKRDPDSAGYAFWLSKLNQFGGNLVNAEMALAFISSPEYRARFGQP